MDLATLLRDAIAKVCDLSPESVRADTLLEDLGVDSLAVAEVIVELEMELDRELPIHLLRQLDHVRTVGDIQRELAAAVTPPSAHS